MVYIPFRRVIATVQSRAEGKLFTVIIETTERIRASKASKEENLLLYKEAFLSLKQKVKDEEWEFICSLVNRRYRNKSNAFDMLLNEVFQ